MKNLPFVMMVYEEAGKVIEDEFFRRMFVAQAILETGWGLDYPEDANNVVGIKPAGTQSFVVYKGSKIRRFISVERCAYSWFYLIRKSSFYATPRDEYQKAIEKLEREFAEAAKQKKAIFAQAFFESYCPTNPQYFKIWNRIRFDIEQELWPPEESE